MGLSHGTHTFRGVNIRLDQVKVIDPLVTKTECLNGWTTIFIKDKNLSLKSQMHFTIWFTNKGGYRDFYSSVVEYTGWENKKVDERFVEEYNNFVERWEKYHDK